MVVARLWERECLTRGSAAGYNLETFHRRRGRLRGLKRGGPQGRPRDPKADGHAMSDPFPGCCFAVWHEKSIEEADETARTVSRRALRYCLATRSRRFDHGTFCRPAGGEMLPLENKMNYLRLDLKVLAWDFADTEPGSGSGRFVRSEDRGTEARGGDLDRGCRDQRGRCRGGRADRGCNGLHCGAGYDRRWRSGLPERQHLGQNPGVEILAADQREAPSRSSCHDKVYAHEVGAHAEWARPAGQRSCL